jgi:hypothetical protein
MTGPAQRSPPLLSDAGEPRQEHERQVRKVFDRLGPYRRAHPCQLCRPRAGPKYLAGVPVECLGDGPRHVGTRCRLSSCWGSRSSALV